MVESLNSTVELATNATSYLGLPEYGKIMVGNRAFEFYSDRNVNKYIQIPWDEIDSVMASIMFKGKWIPRYAIKTKKNGTYTFASKDPKRVLRTIREHIPAEHIVRAPSFFTVLRNTPGNIRAAIAQRKKNKTK